MGQLENINGMIMCYDMITKYRMNVVYVDY